MYSSKEVANWYLDTGDTQNSLITPMKLNKLVYFAHGWYLGYTNEPLIEDTIEAWDYGPVIPELYHEFKHWGSSPIKDRARSWKGIKRIIPRIKNSEIDPFFRKIWQVYKNYSAIGLSRLTHCEGTPWWTTYHEKREEVISNSLIRDYYKQKIDEIAPPDTSFSKFNNR